MDKNLPIYKATISNDETGMYCISLVDEPAVEKDWVYFKEDKPKMMFEVQDEEKHIIRGLIMECNKLIYRRTEDDYEYYITFDEETIRLMAEKYLKDGFQENVDTQHNGVLVDGLSLVQWFISDKENGVNPKGFEDVADHSLFAEFKVDNEEIWGQIKDGTFKGFSLAGIFDPVKVSLQASKQTNVLDEIEDLLSKIQNKLK